MVGKQKLKSDKFRHAFPRLPDSAVITSAEDSNYNCIAWAAGEDSRRWWPVPHTMSVYWPDGVELSVKRQAFIEAYRTRGYYPCKDGSLEPGIEKIALYAKVTNETEQVTHAARQLPSGKWTSKLGDFEDIEHDTPGDVAGGDYGEVIVYLQRPLR